MTAASIARLDVELATALAIVSDLARIGVDVTYTTTRRGRVGLHVGTRREVDGVAYALNLDQRHDLDGPTGRLLTAAGLVDVGHGRVVVEVIGPEVER